MIAVLPADVSDALLADFGRELGERGYAVESSRGAEQLVLLLKRKPGSPAVDAAALASVFAGRADVDLVPVLSRHEYRGRQFRRRFASWLVAGLAFLFTAALCIPVYLFLKPPPVQLIASDLVLATSADRLPENGAKRMSFDGQRVLVVRRDGGSVFAIGARCTHLDGCLLEWSSARKQIVCPCCGGAYDAYGNVIEGPPSIPLRTYGVESIGDELYVRRSE